jgi:hypothetical protein
MAISDCVTTPSSLLSAPANRVSLADNPFAKQESMSNQRLLWFKVLTILSWLLVVVMLFIYHSHHPTEAASSHSIWWQNEHHHSPFGLNKLITDIYWYGNLTSPSPQSLIPSLGSREALY